MYKYVITTLFSQKTCTTDMPMKSSENHEIGNKKKQQKMDLAQT